MPLLVLLYSMEIRRQLLEENRINTEGEKTMPKRTKVGNGVKGGQGFPGRPKKCNIVPKTDGCKKCRKNKGMYCSQCTAWNS